MLCTTWMVKLAKVEERKLKRMSIWIIKVKHWKWMEILPIKDKRINAYICIRAEMCSALTTLLNPVEHREVERWGNGSKKEI